MGETEGFQCPESELAFAAYDVLTSLSLNFEVEEVVMVLSSVQDSHKKYHSLKARWH